MQYYRMMSMNPMMMSGMGSMGMGGMMGASCKLCKLMSILKLCPDDDKLTQFLAMMTGGGFMG